MNPAQGDAAGEYADGYERLADAFARQLADGSQIGAALCVYRDGKPVVDLWGGLADREADRAWQRDTRIVVFSVTKGLAAMAFHLLADRGQFGWDEPVSVYWPGFAANGKESITIEMLLDHRAGLAALDVNLRLEECIDARKRERVVKALENQSPAWVPGSSQGYHAQTFGLYASELFRRIAGEEIDVFLHRELLDPLESDARIGAGAELDEHVARLYPPPARERATNMFRALARQPGSTEAGVARAVLARGSLVRRAFGNPSAGRDLAIYNDIPVRRSALTWASGTSTARGVARAYLPFANGGEHDGRRYFSASSIEPLMERRSWSARDEVLQKPIGWSRGFMKEEPHLFSPSTESFGHSGMGGALGWCDPARGLTFGYVMNRMDWKVRSPRAVALCRALYACEALRD